jgi:hypothetical protein
MRTLVTELNNGLQHHATKSHIAGIRSDAISFRRLPRSKQLGLCGHFLQAFFAAMSFFAAALIR